ncbi:MAG: hypothetical protein K0Q51_709 [Rickettsiaceae bacterium]|jgi:hypothetical protein|nr:hypothetical protein [Rickettsiaceae bacterium]
MKIDLNKILIAPNERYHVYKDQPLYENNFLKVGKFHEPGFAPALDNSGAFHINIQGQAIYRQRYIKAFGFYCGLAAVENSLGSFHINSDGMRIYNINYEWVGNYQEDTCVVRKEGKFFHIDNGGVPIYDEIYKYVGDFKDGIAVVYKDGYGTHIDKAGNYIHNKWFKSLDIFHKGYARAQDNEGWFHIDKNGKPLYDSRYKAVEPFYNDLALNETFDGTVLQIDPLNQIRVIISESKLDYTSILSAEMVGFWKTYIYSAMVRLNIFPRLPATTTSLALALSINEEALRRILRSAWEAEIINYDIYEDSWCLSRKGISLCTQEMSAASIMWAKVASQNWLQLPELIKSHPLNSFLSFKDMETSEDLIHYYQKALDGYSLQALGGFFGKLNVAHDSKLLAFGRSCLSLVYLLKERFPALNVTVTVDIRYFNKHLISTTNSKQVNDINSLKEQYDIVFLIKYIHYFDDKQAVNFLAKLSRLGICTLHIFEIIISDAKPNASMLDINMMIETGGKLRTLTDWEKLISNSGYKIINTEKLEGSLTYIIAERKNAGLCQT